jgi:hypothetical protein
MSAYLIYVRGFKTLNYTTCQLIWFLPTLNSIWKRNMSTYLIYPQGFTSPNYTTCQLIWFLPTWTSILKRNMSTYLIYVQGYKPPKNTTCQLIWFLPTSTSYCQHIWIINDQGFKTPNYATTCQNFFDVNVFDLRHWNSRPLFKFNWW